MPKPVILIAGKHPGYAGGHETYVRAHGLAAMKAGFEPHIFCADHRARVAQHDFGIVHSIASPFPVHDAWNAVYGPLLGFAIENFLRNQSPPHLLHGFGAWGCVGASVKRRLARRGVAVSALTSAYTTALHETRGHVQESRIKRGLGKWLRYR